MSELKVPISSALSVQVVELSSQKDVTARELK